MKLITAQTPLSPKHQLIHSGDVFGAVVMLDTGNERLKKEFCCKCNKFYSKRNTFIENVFHLLWIYDSDLQWLRPLCVDALHTSMNLTVVFVHLTKYIVYVTNMYLYILSC